MDASLTPVSDSQVKKADEIQLVIFALAGCELALDIKEVREILRVADITPMPKAPKYLEGIINVRGRIFPVLDLKKRFEMPLVEKTEESRILVVEHKDQVVGLLVDKVAEVLKALSETIEPSSQPILNIESEFIKGLLRAQDRLIVLFRAERIFTFEGLKPLPELDTTSIKEGKNLDH